MSEKLKNKAEEIQEELRDQTEKMSDEFENFKDSAEELLKTMAEAGLGLLNLARDRFDRTVSELADRPPFSKSEDGEEDIDLGARKTTIVTNFREEAEKVRDNIETKVSEVRDTLRERLDVPTRAEFDKLKKRVKKLEKALKEQKSK